MKKKVVVLLSAGLDSSVNLFEACNNDDVVLALTFDYGQKAAKKEIDRALKLSEHLGVPHKVISLPWFRDFNKSSLLMENEAIPTGSVVNIESHQQSLVTAKSVWVPNRNGIFLNIAAAFAESLGAKTIVPGFNAEEAATFPDNSESYLKEVTRALFYSTANHVEAECYTSQLQKVDIVKRGVSLKIPWHLLWPCYFAGDQWCGKCESCLRSKRAFVQAGVNMEKMYASTI